VDNPIETRIDIAHRLTKRICEMHRRNIVAFCGSVVMFHARTITYCIAAAAAFAEPDAQQRKQFVIVLSDEH